MVRVIYDNILTDYRRAGLELDKLSKMPGVPSYQVNRIEGDIHFNRGDYFESVKYYKRALYDRNASLNDDFQMKIIKRLLMCYYYTDNYQRMAYYADRLGKLARKNHSKGMKAVVDFCEAKLALKKGNGEQAYRLMRNAIAGMKNSDYPAWNNDVCYYYLTLTEVLQDSGRNHDAMETLRAMERHIADMDAGGKDHDFSGDIWAREILAHKAVLYSRLGKPDSARVFYRLFRNSPIVYEYYYACIIPYLTDNGMYRDIIELSEQRGRYLMNSGEESDREMAFIHRTLGDAYLKTGDYPRAVENYQKLDSLLNLIRQAENQSAIDELAFNYEEKHQEIEYERHISRMRQTSIVVVAIIIIVAISILVLRERHNLSVIKRKNRWMARYIEKMQQTSSEMSRQDAATSDNTPEAASVGSAHTAAAEDVDHAIYMRLTREIISSKLYLNPGLNRDELLNRFSIPRNKFSQLFKKYGQTTYTQFINSLRLEHAVRLMRTRPNYTVDAIAKECGIASTVTLYNLFSQQYGMTPTEYRKALVANAL